MMKICISLVLLLFISLIACSQPTEVLEKSENAPVLEKIETAPKRQIEKVLIWNYAMKAMVEISADNLLKKSLQYQTVARAASGGAMGCGFGTYEYRYADGQTKSFDSGLDAIHVFSNKIGHDVLSVFIDARVADTLEEDSANDYGTLFYVILSIVAETADPSSLDSVMTLMLDRNETVARYALTATKSILAAHPEHKSKIESFCSKHEIKL